ncbi:zinc-finger homeodomain protein 11-like [Aristolochia californica]|uniref:zinc-finger homeodomain protein 11-like n=1 Tax=Aristolochia californica TaxID=171875 RepID=UPI0035DBB552
MELESDSSNECYRECLRNHAASLGSYATDGCGEFTPSEPSGLQCAACGCHRNFHRKVVAVRHIQAESEESDPVGKRRVRTKFSPEQKEKMHEFAEKIGWRIQRRDKEDQMEIQRFCKAIGVSRQVFKVWMHNHKSTSASASSARNGYCSAFSPAIE